MAHSFFRFVAVEFIRNRDNVWFLSLSKAFRGKSQQASCAGDIVYILLEGLRWW